MTRLLRIRATALLARPLPTGPSLAHPARTARTARTSDPVARRGGRVCRAGPGWRGCARPVRVARRPARTSRASAHLAYTEAAMRPKAAATSEHLPPDPPRHDAAALHLAGGRPGEGTTIPGLARATTPRSAGHSFTLPAS